MAHTHPRNATPSATLALSLALIGCGGRLPPPTVEPRPYAGPDVALDAAHDEHVLVFEAPTPGYLLFIDRADRTRDPSPATPLGVGVRTVYVTVQEPDPAHAYAQLVVNQRLALGIPPADPIKVFVRQVPFGARKTSAMSYRLAAKSAGVP